MVDIKSTSNAVWWIKKPKEAERHTTLCQDMTDLFRNISMHGYDKLLDVKLFLYEKYVDIRRVVHMHVKQTKYFHTYEHTAGIRIYIFFSQNFFKY